MKPSLTTKLGVTLAGVFALSWQVQAQNVLPSIRKGTIAIQLKTVASGMAAPLYAISPPGDPRLFVLEQKGLILILQNGVLLPTPALDMQTQVSPPIMPMTNAGC
jgi:hypothetical protein